MSSDKSFVHILYLETRRNNVVAWFPVAFYIAVLTNIQYICLCPSMNLADTIHISPRLIKVKVLQVTMIFSGLSSPSLRRPLN